MRRLREWLGHDDGDRVDGRELPEPDEPGSDDRLLRGLLLMLAEKYAADRKGAAGP
jgi:hypothetical protein